jgi:LysM repeat protein
VARYAAPVAFLVAVTIGLLLVRSALEDEERAPGSGPAVTQATSASATPSREQASGGQRQVYRIRAGDTLESVAARFETTVEHIVELNPGIDPTGLQVGRRIRVK